MAKRQIREGHLYRERRAEVLEKFQRAAIAREEYLLRKQRKEILEKCRRIGIVGASLDRQSQSYVFFLKLYGVHRDLHSFPPRRASDLSGGQRCSRISFRCF